MWQRGSLLIGHGVAHLSIDRLWRIGTLSQRPGAPQRAVGLAILVGGAVAGAAPAAIDGPSARGLAETPSPARGRTAVVQAFSVLGGAARALRTVAVALCLGQATVGARAIRTDLAQRYGRRPEAGRRGRGGLTVAIADAVKLEALAVAAAIGAAVAFDLWSC